MNGSSWSCIPSSPSQCPAEKENATRMGAGDGLGHGRQRLVNPAFVFESMAQDLDLHGLAFVPTREDGAGQGQVTVCERAGLPILLDRSRSSLFLPRGRQAQVGVLSQLHGSPPRSLGQVTLGQGLQAPDDALDQPGLVPHPRLFPKHLGVLGPQLAHGHALERCHLLGDIYVHTVLLSRRTRNRQPTLFTEPRKSAHLKASLSGFRRFLSRERTCRNLGSASGNCLDLSAHPSTDPALAAVRRPRCPLFENPKNRETCHGSIEESQESQVQENQGGR